jgi:hypothetical protein
LKREDVCLAIELWDRYTDELQEELQEVVSCLQLIFQKTPFLLEFKLYFLDKVMNRMNYSQLDLIISEIEAFFFTESDAK